MFSETAQMSQDLSVWNLKFLNVSLSEEREEIQLAHYMLQSLSWKMTYKNSFKDIYKFISAKIKCIFWKLMPIFWLREDTGDKGKLDLSAHNSSCEQSSLASLVQWRWILFLFLWITWCSKTNVEKLREMRIVWWVLPFHPSRKDFKACKVDYILYILLLEWQLFLFPLLVETSPT